MKSPTGRTKILAPVRANAGIEAEYRRRLDRMIDEMHRSLCWWIGAAWEKNEPEIAKLAADASPARTLLDIIRSLTRRWQTRFDQLAPDLALWFSTQAKDRSDFALRQSLKRAGLTVKFHTTRAVNDALRATLGENVGLIRSIASQHLTQVEGMVMRSVQRGGDLGELAAGLEYHYGVTKRRAALISRDQNRKATAVIARVRSQELGITEAVWMHSAGGKEPRPSHVTAGREHARYRISQGWFDPHEKRFIYPGELINCRCVSRPVLPGA